MSSMLQSQVLRISLLLSLTVVQIDSFLVRRLSAFPTISSVDISTSTSTARTTVSTRKMSMSEDDVAAQGLLVSCIDKLGMVTGDGDKSKPVILLASQSPRRREILDMMGLENRYYAQPSPLDEEALQAELATQEILPTDYARILAERKASAMSITLPESPQTFVIGSDTIVDIDGQILNKPTSEEDAFRMLGELSGKKHQVHTGVAVYSGETKCFSFTETANVCFQQLTEEDIRAYIATGEPMDKAGSYGIQGIGGQLVERIDGSYFAVMGLPMHSLSRELAKLINSL